MDLTRRFVFRGNASAIAGQIYRPKTIIVDVNCGGSSLGVSGGRSQSQIEGQSFGDIIKFGSAFTLAEGLFDDEKQAAAVTDHKGKQSRSRFDDDSDRGNARGVGGRQAGRHAEARARHARQPRAAAAAESRRLRRPATPRFRASMIGGNALDRRI